MTDLIKRSDALEVAYRYCPDDDGSCSCADRDLREMLDDIEDIPSADRPRGEWIDDTEHTEHYWANCSICGLQIDVHENRGYHNFCPNCGADMRGADDE